MRGLKQQNFTQQKCNFWSKIVNQTVKTGKRRINRNCYSLGEWKSIKPEKGEEKIKYRQMLVFWLVIPDSRIESFCERGCNKET